MSIIAKQAYQPGHVIITNCKPFIKVLSYPERANRCAYCFSRKRPSELLKCSGCKNTLYCNRTCHVKDWKKAHKIECQLLLDLNCVATLPGDYSHWPRIVIRLYTTLKINPEDAEKKFPMPDGSTRCFNDLMHHAEYEKSDPNNQEHRTMLSIIADWIAESKEERHTPKDPEELKQLTNYLTRLYSIYKTNSIEIRDKDDPLVIGYGIYIQSSAFLHSCMPNASLWNPGPQTILGIRVVHPIAVGEPIYISHLSVRERIDDRATRRQTLFHRFRSECNCSRCSSSEDEVIHYSRLRTCINNTLPVKNIKEIPGIMDVHNRVIVQLRRIFHEYDPGITTYYFKTLLAILVDVRDLPRKEIEPFLKDVLLHVEITFGAEHFEYLRLQEILCHQECGYAHLFHTFVKNEPEKLGGSVDTEEITESISKLGANADEKRNLQLEVGIEEYFGKRV